MYANVLLEIAPHVFAVFYFDAGGVFWLVGEDDFVGGSGGEFGRVEGFVVDPDLDSAWGWGLG